jgi:predicted DNA-binding helix-hairpin-helix protein
VRRIARRIDKLKPFIVTADWTPGPLTDSADLRERLTPAASQMSLF